MHNNVKLWSLNMKNVKNSTVTGHTEVDRLSEKMQTIGINRKPDSVKVYIYPRNEIMNSIVKGMYRSITNKLSLRGSATIRYTEEELLTYCENLVVNRVNWVNRVKGTVNPRNQAIYVPSCIALVIDNIGTVRENKLGIKCVPTLPEDYTPTLLSQEDMEDMGSWLQSLESIGMEGEGGFKASTEGNWDFMTFSMLEGEMLRFNADSHPSWSVLASIVTLHGIESLLSPRVSYGDIDMYKSFAYELSKLKGDA